MHRLQLTLIAFVLCLLLSKSMTDVAAAEPIDSAKGVADSVNRVVWYDLTLLDVEGRGWTDTKAFYDRLPARAEMIVGADVWRLSRQPSGICARFVTDATSLRVEWLLGIERLAESNMPATAISGVDLYVKHEGRWRWLAVGKPESTKNNVMLFSDIPAGEREFLLYLPLYNVVSSIKLGLPQRAKLAKADSYPSNRKPIVFYGTSITQGGCASRPGMVYTAILGRRLNHPVINLGFRSNGTLDPEMAPFFAELDPAIYVLDCLPNMNAPEITERVEPFVAAIRAARPETPILLAEDRTYPDGFLNRPRNDRNTQSRVALKTAYDRLMNAGVRHLYYLEGSDLLGDDGEATVDGSHPTDLGSVRMADAFEKVLRPILLNTHSR